MFNQTKAKTIEEYIDLLEEPRKSQVKELDKIIRETVPQLKPEIISGMPGYGKYHYKYLSGREGDWYVVGLASQKNYISLYICSIVDGGYLAEKYRGRLPKADIGKSCVRFKKIEDVDLSTIKGMLKEAARLGGAFQT